MIVWHRVLLCYAGLSVTGVSDYAKFTNYASCEKKSPLVNATILILDGEVDTVAVASYMQVNAHGIYIHILHTFKSNE